jgi:hypothetical protein
LLYFGLLFANTYKYLPYYDDRLTRVPFDFYSVAVGGTLSFVSLLIAYITLIHNHKNLVAEFLTTQKLKEVFNSDLFRDLQKGEPIREIKKLTGGYSGAQVYSFYRGANHVPDILKIADKEEIDNEYQKFKKHIDHRLIIGPNICLKYPWGNYAGLEYNLNWRHLGSDHLTFFEIYKKGLHRHSDEPQVSVEIDTIESIIESLFVELRKAWGWMNLGRINVNIYEEYYPFTQKFDEIQRQIRRVQRRRSNSGLNTTVWATYWDTLHDFLDVNAWNGRIEETEPNHPCRARIARATIHGDLNSRNVLLEADPTNYNDIHTIGVVDFSHTGNGLTIKRTNETIQYFQKIFHRPPDLDAGQSHIANDFCRLEADIKFYLTDLNDEQDLWKAWFLECLLLKYGLGLPDWQNLKWEELKEDGEFRKTLGLQALLNKVNEPKITGPEDQKTIQHWLDQADRWEKLIDPNCWTEDNARKFILAWQSVKAIRGSLREILQGAPPSMDPFYLALLQASLTMIYYEDDRFHNANLQKLYLVLASGLLCERLLEQPGVNL